MVGGTRSSKASLRTVLTVRWRLVSKAHCCCCSGVELGCGVGTAGLMLAKVYTRMRMTLTDQPQCISLAEENVSFNNLGDRVTVSAYSWGDSVDTFAADPPDFVVATDVLYHASVFDKFLSSLEAFAGLRRERSIRVVIAYQPRTDDDKEFVKRVLLPRLEELSILRYEDDREVDSSTTCVLFLGRIKAASVYSVQCVFKATGGGIEPAPSHLVTRHKIATTQSERITGLMISPTCRPKCMSISSARGTISPLRISEGTPPRLSGLISIRARQTVRLPWFEVPE